MSDNALAQGADDNIEELELVLVRGVTGSGKTTFAKKTFPNYNHFEADMYHINEDGEYKFDATKIKDAHGWCQSQTRESLERGESCVVSNTFTTLWELKYYRHLAKELNVPLRVYRMNHIYGNIHDVPKETVDKMIANLSNPKNDYEGEIIVDNFQK